VRGQRVCAQTHRLAAPPAATRECRRPDPSLTVPAPLRIPRSRVRRRATPTAQARRACGVVGMGFPWGLDFGNQNCVIAIARKGGIDVIDNEASSRKVSCPHSTLHAGLRAGCALLK